MNQTITAARPAAKRRVSIGVWATLLILLLLETGSRSVAGAAFTTTVTGARVNANLYPSKCDVYINGGPNNGVSALSDGQYFFAVLAPGGQKDPNDGTAKNLSSVVDSVANRTFTVSGNHIVSTTGTHSIIDDPSTTTITNDKLIQLCDYANTPNRGGVYILAICSTAALPVDPRDCKYDAFKVKASGAKRVSDLVALKTATPAFDRENSWSIDKGITNTTVDQGAGTVTIDYRVDVVKTVTDSNYRVTGDITVFNPNDKVASSVAVVDSIPGGVCVVTPPTGFLGSIAANSSETFTYSCSFATVQTGSATNTATITWNRSALGSPTGSTTATAGFTWPSAPSNTPTVPGTVTVRDTLGGTTVTLGTTSSSATYAYTKVISVTWTGCQNIDNTATIVETGQTDSASYRLCTSTSGFTKGYWHNRNGQAKIATAVEADLCEYLEGFNLVLNDLVAAGTTCSTESVQNYVLTLFDLATASGTGEAMYKAQFIATALSAYFDPTLASTSIVVDGDLLGTTDCITVADLLVAANSSYPTLLTNKSSLMEVKDYLDRVNNNVAIVC